MMPRRQDGINEERFWSKVDRSDPDGCWPWLAGRHFRGYGFFAVNGRNVRANRVAYRLQVGPIPPGLFVCHRCDNPPCVRGDHLFLGTHQDNMDDMAAKGRRYRPPVKAKPERPKRPRGRHRLTAVQVREIRRLYRAGGVTLKGLGTQFGVSPGHP